MHSRRNSDAKSYGSEHRVTFRGARRPCCHEHNSRHGRHRQRRPPPRHRNSQQQASRSARSPASPDTARLPGRRHRCQHLGTTGLPGASAVFLNSRALGDELGPSCARPAATGVTRLVALSAINADDDFSRQPSRFRGDRNKEVEQLAVDSGLEWVSLRPTVFVTNFFGMWAPQIQAGDVVDGPYAAASTAPIVDRDISAVAATALLTDELVGRRIPLDRPAGPDQHRACRRRSAAFSVARCATTRCLPNWCASASSASGFPRRIRRRLHRAAGGDGEKPALVTHDVEKILGRPADVVRRRSVRTSRTCSPITKGDNNV